jgi:hypothetical protein
MYGVDLTTIRAGRFGYPSAAELSSQTRPHDARAEPAVLFAAYPRLKIPSAAVTKSKIAAASARLNGRLWHAQTVSRTLDRISADRAPSVQRGGNAGRVAAGK